MIRAADSCFVLETAHTTYAFRVLETGHLEHLYYGRRITLPELTGEALAPLTEKHSFAPGNTSLYDQNHPEFSLEDLRLELSGPGKGDLREPFVELEHADGGGTSDFLYESHAAGPMPEKETALPGGYDDTGAAQRLNVTLRDRAYGLTLTLRYDVYEDCDVIARSAVLVNDSAAPVILRRLLSTQLDFDPGDYVLTTFTGAWAREMCPTPLPLRAGRYVNASCTGTSSSRANPFVMLSRSDTTEDAGDCYGFHLIYSGNHYEAAEVSGFGKIRFVSGINPQTFRWLLAPGERFETPEAAMAYSPLGCNGMSQCMHRFVREHIVRGVWKKKPRPVLLNSWEAAYFNINQSKLLSLARKAREAGAELFVVDDGWFGNRNDDTSSLGDWEANEKKLPGGLAALGENIRAMGLDFGIWVEPEMVSVNSNLYRAHPDWTLEIPGKAHSEGRSQRILDLTRREVQDYIIHAMTRVFSGAPISYVKWDMNRNFTDCYSAALPPQRQGEVAHRYVLGLYRCMRELTLRFPDILFEGCASGGNRFDLGILCYFPQIWASDNTDALCRAEIQTGCSYGYPPSVTSAHVSSCPNHQTLRVTPLETRFAVAAFGVCGYECNLNDLSREEFAAVQVQIALYKQWREVFQFGSFYRGSRPGQRPGESALRQSSGNLLEWTCVSPDQTRAVGLLLQKLAVPNAQYHCYRPKGLNPAYRYRFCNRSLKYNIKPFGDLVNTVAPVHIRQDSLAHNLIARLVHLDGETEACSAWGDTLMYGGVRLKQSFGGTGYNSDVRYFQDFGARMYFMEREPPASPLLEAHS